MPHIGGRLLVFGRRRKADGTASPGASAVSGESRVSAATHILSAITGVSSVNIHRGYATIKHIATTAK